MRKLQIEPSQEGVFKLSGAIGIDLDLSSLLEVPHEHLILDLSGINDINSIGIKKWIENIKLLKGQGKSIEYQECSEVFIRQCNFILDLTSGVAVSSFEITFACEDCEIYEPKLLRREDLDLDQLPPIFVCPSCGEMMDPEESDAFNFLTNFREYL